MPDSTKSRLGKYELLEEIGDGAEGRIFKARCVEAGVPEVSVGDFVALKRLRQTGNETQSDIFRRTSRILRALNHPNIVRYKDSFIGTDEALDEEVYCLVTELLEGETLKELLDRNKTGLPWDRAQRITLSTLEALEYASKNSIIHRDLKPSNIYLTKNDDVKLIDFGIARHEDSGSTTTSTGALLGSFDFMAPDFVLVQEGNFRGDQQSDIFSFGVCFYQVLTGVLPFPPLGGNAQIAYFQRYVSPEKIPKVKYNHPIFSVLRGARVCLEKCLTYSRENRYKTFSELLAAIKAIQRRTLHHADGDGYEYLEYIGKGGFGKVFRARRLRDDFEVAVKEVLADRNSSRFIREAKLLKVTQHPHLVQYLDFVEVTDKMLGEDRRLFLVLEYLHGMPESGLNYRIKTTPGGMDPVEVLQQFDAYLDCLDYLHQNTIIHRDIKPGNLYAPARSPQRAKIFDLGIAHDTEGTKTHGQVPGTLDYMPPEFATQGGDRGSAQSDIYSIGVTLFQALTGKLPYERLPEDEKMAWTNWYLRCENPPPISYGHVVFRDHPELEKLLQLALAPRPQDRYPSAKAMRDEIRAVLANWDQAVKKEAYDKAMTHARAELDKQNYDAAASQARVALEAWPEGTDARQLLDRIETERLRRSRYDGAVSAAKSELEKNNIDAARRHVRLALEIWPEGVEARQFLDGIETARQRRVQYEGVIAGARKDLEREDLEAAARQASEALALWPDGAEARQLLEEIEAARERKGQCETATERARQFLEKGDLDDASSQAQFALDLLPENADAKQLLDRIETERLRRLQYDTALLAAKSEFEKNDIDAATRHARLAVEIWPEGTDARQLLDQMVGERNRRTQYDAAIAAAKRDVERGNFDEAIQKAREAAEKWPDKDEPRQLLAKLETERQRKTQYDSAIAAAREALEKFDFDEAIRKAQLALKVWPEKPEARRLLDRIDTEKARKTRYDAAIAAAKEALDQRQYESVKARIEEALSIKPRDPAAMELRAQADKALRELEDDEPVTVATPVTTPTDQTPASAAAVEEPPALDEPRTAATILEPPPPVEPPKEIPAPPPEPEPEPVAEPELVVPVATPPVAPIAPGPVHAPEPRPEPVKSKHRKKSNAPVMVAVAAVVVLLVGAGLWFMRGSHPQPAAPVVTTSPPAPAQTTPPPVAPPALVLYGDGTITRDVSDKSSLLVACLARNPDGLRIESSKKDLVPQALYSIAKMPNAATNGYIWIQLRPGYTGEADVTVTAAGGGLSPVTKTVRVRITGQPSAPRLETTSAEYAMNQGAEAAIPVTGRSDYGFGPAEFGLTVKSVDHPERLTVSPPQRTANGFSVPLRAAQPGTVELALVLTAPNGAAAAKNIRVVIKPKASVALPLEITGLPAGMIMGTFGQNAPQISLEVTGGAQPLSLDYAFSPELARKGQVRGENIGSGERFSIPVPQGAGSRNKLTATVTDAAGHQVSATSQIQFIPTNSIGMPLVWIPGMPGCNAQWMDLAAGGWVGRFEVTQEEFAYLMGVNPSKYKTGGRFPVESMTYDQAMRFCDELTRRDGQMLPHGWHYTLPAQAQWEFFAAGTPVNNEYAYFVRSTPKPAAPEEVGQLKPNPFGLYDVLGNVAELTSTHWASTDPAEANFYTCRGGGFKSASTTMVIDHQQLEANKPWMFNVPRADVGFRVVVVSQ